MKKLLFILLLLMTVCCNVAQAGFLSGAYKKLMRSEDGLKLTNEGVNYLVDENYDDAYSCFFSAWRFCGYAPALCYLGACYEMGIGCERDVSAALEVYSTGCDLGEAACINSIQRIQAYGFSPESYKTIYINAIKTWLALMNSSGSSTVMPASNTTPTLNTTPSSNSTPSSTYSTCRICGGSGICTSCNGSGGSWQDTGYYTGSGNKSWISCGSCNGNKRCFNCHGTGKQ